MHLLAALGAIAAFAVSSATASAQGWHEAPGRLQTKWAADVDAARVWPEYPRPTFVREAWNNLNGLWDYAITDADAEMLERGDGRILVPFPLESSLSGVARALQPEQRLWYRRSFSVPSDAAWRGRRILLHFGAVDWQCEVFVDGARVGEHRGGYDPFSFEITAALRTAGEHVLTVAVRDPSDAGPQPRGKQVHKPGGIWYTPCSGIWQTVWLEPVPAAFVRELHATTDLASRTVTILCDVDGARPGDRLVARVQAPTASARWDEQTAAIGTAEVALPAAGGVDLRVTVPAETFRPWQPGDPALYPVRIVLLRDANGIGAIAPVDTVGALDTVDSYTAFREVTVGKDAPGTTRLLLNGEPRFQFGPLDQGYWPDGIYTPPTFAAMCADLDTIAAHGCNMLRKHVKVECELFYAECDKRGILVWQDMPSGDTQKDPAGFERELRALIATHSQHPSIVLWVVFNEGWGQHDTQRYVDLVRSLDPTRLIGNASGWTDAHCGDVVDLHSYPGPAMLPPEEHRASVLGEYGGLGLPLDGHTWVDRDNWGYVSYPSADELQRAYVDGLQQLRPLIAQGLSAAVYTQTTDVEVECNGWLTYDRAVDKVRAAAVRAATQRLYEPPGTLATVVPSAVQGPQSWRWATAEPPDGWQQPGFDDTAWNVGQSGFGSAGTPGARIGTVWNGPSIWLRRAITLPATALHEPLWCVHHDEDIEVFVDGQRVLARTGYTRDYAFVPADEAARTQLVPGRHVMAVHCTQTTGGQYVDVGISDLVPPR